MAIPDLFHSAEETQADPADWTEEACSAYSAVADRAELVYAFITHSVLIHTPRLKGLFLPYVVGALAPAVSAGSVDAAIAFQPVKIPTLAHFRRSPSSRYLCLFLSPFLRSFEDSLRLPP
jgi:hypothetical protein